MKGIIRKPAAFNLDAAVFTTGKLAEIAEVDRRVVDVWLNRGLLQPVRRERSSAAKRRPGATSQGRPLFAIDTVFQVRLARELGHHIGLGLSEWIELAQQLQHDGVVGGQQGRGGGSTASRRRLHEIAKVTAMAAGGNWMWANARAIESGESFVLHGYATNARGKWLMDVAIGDRHAPCFGLATPHIFIPMSSIFAEVYRRAKEMLGVTVAQPHQTMPSRRRSWR